MNILESLFDKSLYVLLVIVTEMCAFEQTMSDAMACEEPCMKPDKHHKLRALFPYGTFLL